MHKGNLTYPVSRPFCLFIEAVLGLPCWAGFALAAVSGAPPAAVQGLLTVASSLAEHGLSGARLQWFQLVGSAVVVSRPWSSASVVVGLSGGSAGKEPPLPHPRSAGDLSSIPGLGRSPGEGKGYPLQYSGLHSPWGRKESDTTERPSLTQELWHTGLAAPWHVGSSWTTDRIRVSSLGRFFTTEPLGKSLSPPPFPIS